MASERIPPREAKDKQQPSTPLAMTDSIGETVPLDDAYLRHVAEARRARLAAPPLTDEELARMREQHPDQAWFWTTSWQRAAREADEDIEAGRGTIYYSDEELLAALDGR